MEILANNQRENSQVIQNQRGPIDAPVSRKTSLEEIPWKRRIRIIVIPPIHVDLKTQVTEREDPRSPEDKTESESKHEENNIGEKGTPEIPEIESKTPEIESENPELESENTTEIINPDIKNVIDLDETTAQNGDSLPELSSQVTTPTTVDYREKMNDDNKLDRQNKETNTDESHVGGHSLKFTSRGFKVMRGIVVDLDKSDDAKSEGVSDTEDNCSKEENKLDVIEEEDDEEHTEVQTPEENKIDPLYPQDFMNEDKDTKNNSPKLNVLFNMDHMGKHMFFKCGDTQQVLAHLPNWTVDDVCKWISNLAPIFSK
eukprot:UN34200